ncbi:MAG: DnaJ domain-containing protein [Oscillospiraceae bacterium]|jgi:curved DNA-binding protein CbpA|nr:DnaJ domain-containing protein [Oscillospiraceae bacterium]MCI2036349.1 DnaJ domain-containing protein [Oscillospiraceae bacterium]
MSDPYKILGISPTASDEEVKAAYRALAKKYHPDQYADSPLADLADEKMKEINEAYDQIMQERRQRKAGPQPGYAGSGHAGSDYIDVRNLIVSGRVADAEQILDGVPPEKRNAEWYFLKGTVLYKRGWLDEAYNDFARASQMDPNNAEYRAALNQAANQRSGMYGGYNPNVPQAGNCTGCDVCTSLCVADACCDCMGGGIGPCC